MNSHPHTVIVGAGHAGGALAIELREKGYHGRISLIGSEPFLPYQRPPLSKAFLKGEIDDTELLLKNAGVYDSLNITCLLEQTVTGINRRDKQVSLGDGSMLDYDYLILATGAQARALDIPGANLDGILSLRDINDGNALKNALTQARTLAIIGGGYVGLEVAASARKLGLEVVVIEREPRLLARVASEPLARFFQDFHQQQGVTVITNAQVKGFDGTGNVSAVLLEDGRRIECDVALVGVGAIARDSLAREAGLECANGVVVDEQARSSDPHIFAIGDLSWRPLPVYGERMFRLESVPSALEQARQVSCAITGQPAPAPEVPWFWSDQYSLKLQIAGIPFDATRQIIRGAPEQAKFAVYHLADDKVVAVEALNSPLDFIAGKQLIGAASRVNPDLLADPGIKAKDAVLL